uniref:Mutator-like transposase domain-containing protein n=1 Tax=Rhipicephalus appendiculatus TaxID=34631 RepID=A0A131Z220_RHIAP
MGRKYSTVHQFGKKRRKKGHWNFQKKAPPTADAAGDATAAPTVSVEASMTVDSRQHRNGLDTDASSSGDPDSVQQHADETVGSSLSLRSSDRGGNVSASHAAESEYMIVDLEAINGLLRNTVCRTCRGSLSIAKDEREYGLAVKLRLVCSNCGLADNGEWSSPRVAGTARIGRFEVNVLASSAAKKIGIGPTALNNMLSTMGLSRKGQRKTNQEDEF